MTARRSTHESRSRQRQHSGAQDGTPLDDTLNVTPPATDARQAEPARSTRRLPGPDVVRAIAMFGVVVMNYHGYLISRGAPRTGGWWYGFFDPWTGPLSTRFAATFVVTAGVGVSLLTRRVATDHSPAAGARAAEMSWLLVRRGLLLYGVGMVFDFIWAGTILPYYGAMFVLAAVLWRLPSWTLASVGVLSAVAAWRIHLWAVAAAATGSDVSWLTRPGPRSPAGLIFNLFVNGTHPLLPWLAFFTGGMIVGRVLRTPRLVAVVFAVGTALWLFALPLGLAANEGGPDGGFSLSLSPHPFDRSMVYTTSALGTALIAFSIISALANRFASSMVIDSLARAGQMSLTIYLGHALIFNLLVDWLGWLKPGGLGTALIAATAYWVLATAAAIGFQRRVGRGPAEWLYRRLTAS